MNEEPISPWTDHAERASLDGNITAVFRKGREIAMGAPAAGELIIKRPGAKDQVITDDAAASFVWSDDGRFLAFSKWRRDRNQSLCVLSIAEGTVDESPDEFRVLELRAFCNGRIEGVDSPIYMPRAISIQYGEANQASEVTARKLA